jgi:hypothetical protein
MQNLEGMGGSAGGAVDQPFPTQINTEGGEKDAL